MGTYKEGKQGSRQKGQNSQEKQVQERTRTLELTREEAEAATRAKNALLSDLSHELRTPLSGILGISELRLARDLPDNIRNDFEMIQDAASSLLYLVNNMFHLTQIESGLIELREERIDLELLCGKVRGFFEFFSRDKSISFSTHVAPDVPPQVTGDEDRLAQILKNLVMNAIQYTEKGDITLSITPLQQAETSARLLFAVSDTGLGLPAEEQEDIFASPPLGETSRSGDYPRSGLGLTIARQLAELMNGNIEAASEQGKGSTFRFEAEFGKIADTKETAQQEPALNLDDLPSLTFLLAEDSRVNRVFLYRALTRAGHRVILAEDGRDAIDALNTEHVDCIIMDIQMPEVNGLEATRRIRRGESGKNSPDVPILALTAYAMKGDSERFLAAGMDGYLSKPVNFLDLARAIQNVIKARSKSS